MRAARAWLITTVTILFLAACTSVDVPTVQEALPPVAGEVLGTGTVRVAMLLPLSATGNAAQLAKDMRNAADLALREFPNSNLQILIKDDRGTPDGARAAASAAVSPSRLECNLPRTSPGDIACQEVRRVRGPSPTTAPSVGRSSPMGVRA